MGLFVPPRALRAVVAICLASAWLHCQGSPRLVELHRMLPTTTSVVRQAVLGDIDGDGARDLVLHAGARSNVCRSVGGGRFEMVPNALPPLPPFARLVLADLDGDGDRDCAVAVPANCDVQSANCSGGADFVLWNDGSGRFGAPGPALPADPAVISTAVAAGDVDGDGDIDLVFGCAPHVWTDASQPPQVHSVRGENWLFLNNGTGNFTAANSRLGADRDATNAVLLEDFDGDGDRDLFAANGFGGSSQQDAYYRNDGLGNFTRIAGALPVDADDAKDAQTLDIDNDGDRDVLLLTAQGLRLLRNNGLGTFADASANVTAPAGTIDQLFVGDFDGDGDIDIGLRSGGTVRQLRNNGTGLFAHAPAADRTGNPGTALAGDFDADGDLDLALLRGGYLDHSLWLNDGSGAWSPVPDELPPTLANQFAPVAVDIDNDGDLDVVACAENAVNTVYRNDGSGRFSIAGYGDFTTDVFLGEACAAGDLDGDGYADVAVANAVLPFFGIVPSQIYHNNGAGRLDRVPLPAVDAMSVAIGDLDRDGDLDVYFGCTGVDVVLRNQGNMTFVPIVGAVTDTLPTKAVALGDVDFDGDLDAVLVGWFGTPQRVLLNNGTGVFTALPGALPNHLDDSQHVLLADIDHDADLDILVANDGGATPQTNRCYRNNGFGVFTENGQDLPPGNSRTISLTAADFDGDGDLDLIETAFQSPVPTRLLENDGQGHFTVVAGGLPEVRDYAHEFAAGDFDRDGDLDAFLIAQGQPSLYCNLRRQVCWRDLPRLGRTLTIELFGAPGDPFVLGCSPNRIDVPWPGFGQLQIDPATLLRLEFGTLDAQGRSARAFAVPADPALLDQTFFWQALLGNAARLTNLELTTLRRP